MYENLASKYRPSTLGDLLGQDAVKTTLSNAVKLNRVAHSYVFYGPRGCGKTTVARILAKTLNCHNPDKNGNPCGKCPSCLEVTESKSLDVIEIDAASNTNVDNVRSVIVDQVNFAPARDKYKIYILDEVHMLSKGSFNALLKTLEEPPKHVVFIMATTEQEKVPATILSRSQCFRFKFIPEADMISRLKEIAAKENLKIDSESLNAITKASGGAMRDALTLLDRAASFCNGVITCNVLNELLGRPSTELLRLLALALINRDSQALHSAFDTINTEGYDIFGTLRELRNLLIEVFFVKSGYKDGKEPIKGMPPNVAAASLARISRKLGVIIKEIQYSDIPSVAAEVALFTIIEIPQDLSSLVKRLEALEARISGIPEVDAGLKKKELTLNGISENKTVRSIDSSEHEGLNKVNAVSNNLAVPNGFADGWRTALGKISSTRPFLYNELASCKIVNNNDGSITLVAENKMSSNRIAQTIDEIESLMFEVTKNKIKFLVTYGNTIAKKAVKIAPAPEVDNDDNVDEVKSSTGEIIKADAPAEVMETEAPVAQIKGENIKPAVPDKKAEKRINYAEGEKAKNKIATVEIPQHNTAHVAAKLDYVSEEEMPSELKKLKEIFKESIVKVSKIQ